MRCPPRSRAPPLLLAARDRVAGTRDRGAHLIGHLLARGSATQEGAALEPSPSKGHPHGPPRRHPTQEERVGASFLRAAAGKYVPAHHATLEGGPSTRACWSTGRLARCTMRGGGAAVRGSRAVTATVLGDRGQANARKSCTPPSGPGPAS
jgi:hypothetical protein